VRFYSPPNQMLDFRYWICNIAYRDIVKPIQISTSFNIDNPT
jgi:hypothetical protein